MALKPDNIYVLVVALLTWGGVYAYLLRLDKLAKKLDEEVSAREELLTSQSHNSNRSQ